MLVSSLCGGQVATHSLLLALHSPLLARLLAQAGTADHALTLPFTLQVIRGLVDLMEGEKNVDEGEKVMEAAGFLSMFGDQSKVVTNIKAKENWNDIKKEVLQGDSYLNDIALETEKGKVIKELKKAQRSQTALGITTKKTLIKTESYKSRVNLYLSSNTTEGIAKKRIKKLKSRSKVSKLIEQEFPCDNCSFSLKTQIALNRHMNKKHDIPLPCLKCNEQFEKSLEYKMHMKVNHISYDCKICNIPMTSASTLSVHMQSHQEKMPCSYCGKEYNSRIKLSSHVIRTHGEEIFKCSNCDYKTKVSAQLKTHFKRRHTEQMQAPCESCGEVFKNLKKHLERNTCGAMGQDERVKVPCKLKCGKTFCDNDKMMNHVRNIHGNTKNKVCSQCSYATYSNFNLKLHISKMHLGTKLVKELCPYCEKETRNLNHHIQLYHCETKIENKSRKV